MGHSGPKWDKSGTCLDRILVYFLTEICSEKVPDLSHLGPIWPTFSPNLISLVLEMVHHFDVLWNLCCRRCTWFLKHFLLYQCFLFKFFLSIFSVVKKIWYIFFLSFLMIYCQLFNFTSNANNKFVTNSQMVLMFSQKLHATSFLGTMKFKNVEI